MRCDRWALSYLVQKMLEALELGGGRQPLLEEAVPVGPRIFLRERPLRPVVRVEAPGWKVKRGRGCVVGEGSPPQINPPNAKGKRPLKYSRGIPAGRSLQQLERECTAES